MLTPTPTVSFVVPCYKFAHLLPECVHSILSQTFTDFELLIMDDCSPDNTAEVAASFADRRVKYCRNDHNLGHLSNYNKGIGLARGQYVWLISADDYLCKPYLLERYVTLLNRQPSVGYACCAGLWLEDGRQTGVVPYSRYTDVDCIVPGQQFLTTLLKGNLVLAASGLVRRECYARFGAFPLDMPYTGDWYLWCLFAMHYDVAFFAEPMVCYRLHPQSMTSTVMAENRQQDIGLTSSLDLILAVKQQADAAGFAGVANDCLLALGHIYGHRLLSQHYYDQLLTLTWAQFEASLRELGVLEPEKAIIRVALRAALFGSLLESVRTALGRPLGRLLVNRFSVALLNRLLSTEGLRQLVPDQALLAAVNKLRQAP